MKDIMRLFEKDHRSEIFYRDKDLQAKIYCKTCGECGNYELFDKNTHGRHDYLWIPESMKGFSSHVDSYILKMIAKKVMEEFHKKIPGVNWKYLAIISNANLDYASSGKVENFPSRLTHRNVSVEPYDRLIKYKVPKRLTNNIDVKNNTIDLLKNIKLCDVFDLDDLKTIKSLDPLNEIWNKSCLYFINNFLTIFWDNVFNDGYEYFEYYLIIDEDEIYSYLKDCDYDGPDADYLVDAYKDGYC